MVIIIIILLSSSWRLLLSSKTSIIIIIVVVIRTSLWERRKWRTTSLYKIGYLWIFLILVNISCLFSIAVRSQTLNVKQTDSKQTCMAMGLKFIFSQKCWEASETFEARTARSLQHWLLSHGFPPWCYGDVLISNAWSQNCLSQDNRFLMCAVSA